jgi:hypothetical protein
VLFLLSQQSTANSGPVEQRVLPGELSLSSGRTTSSLATGQDMLTALRRSRFALRYSSSRATRTTISPLSEVRGPEAATKPLALGSVLQKQLHPLSRIRTSGACLLLKNNMALSRTELP